MKIRSQLNQLLERSLSARIALRLLYLWLFTMGLAAVSHAERTQQPIVLLTIGIIWLVTIWRTCSLHWLLWSIPALLLPVVVAIVVWPLSAESAYNLSLRADNQAWHTWLTAPWIHRDLKQLTYTCVAILMSLSVFGWLSTDWRCVVVTVILSWIGDVASTFGNGHGSLGLSGLAAGLLVAAITQSIPGRREQLSRLGETWLYTVIAISTWSVCLSDMYVNVERTPPQYLGGTIGGLLASIGWTWWQRVRPDGQQPTVLMNNL